MYGLFRGGRSAGRTKLIHEVLGRGEGVIYLCWGGGVVGKGSPFCLEVSAYHATVVEEGVRMRAADYEIHRICFCHCQGCEFDMIWSV
jgi:hypothetical protein